jgi:hypothetical protein
MQVLYAKEPEWFNVVGGPPPGDVILRDGFVTVLVVVLGLLAAQLLGEPWRPFLNLVALFSALPVFATLRLRWRHNQQVRVLGNLIEHRDGSRVVRVALNRAVLSTAAAPPGVLVLVLDDGLSQVTVARRAELHELSDLPPCMGPYLMLHPEDFEVVHKAAQRTYAQA